MRQVADTLVWLAMISVIAAVVYFTPRLANYVTSISSEHPQECLTCRGSVHAAHEIAIHTP